MGHPASFLQTQGPSTALGMTKFVGLNWIRVLLRCALCILLIVGYK